MKYAQSLVLVIVRVILGVVLIAHGWQKFNTWGIATTIENFTAMGVPMPGVAGPAAALIELIGGALIILGLGMRIVGVLVAAVMGGAAYFAHIDNGIFASNGGWELVAVIAAAALGLVASGAGLFSVDRLLFKKGTFGQQPVDADPAVQSINAQTESMTDSKRRGSLQ